MSASAHELLKSSLTIKDAVSSINKLESNDGLATSENLVKWKSYEHQVVIESDSYFYKIYECMPNTTQMFDHQVRECLVIVMQELGLDWKLISFERDGQVFDFEQRQKLKVATPEDAKFGEILVSVSESYDRVERMLNFDIILGQLHEMGEFLDVKKLKLTRHCFNKYIDYAVFENNFILLDDAEFYIAPTDDAGNIINVPYVHDFKITINGEEYSLTKLHAKSSNERLSEGLLDAVEDVYPGWLLLPERIEQMSDERMNETGMSSDEEQTGAMMSSEKALSHLVESSVSDFYSRVEEASKVGFCDERAVKNQHLWTEVDSDAINFESYLTDRHEKKLYSQLEDASTLEQQVCLQTALNSNGELLLEEEESFVVWASHMKTISAYFPEVLKVTRIFLTQEFCEYYLNGNFHPQDFMDRYSTMISYVHPTQPQEFPARRTFKRFLLKYAKTGEKSFWSILQEERKSEKCQTEGLQCYSDSDACMLRDYEQVCQMFQ